MSFSETLKEIVKRKADYTCCWCLDRINKVEIHHIKPQAEGGIDLEENAAPLCSNCHTLYGANPELRKEIVSRRNHWYEKCSLTPTKRIVHDFQADSWADKKIMIEHDFGYLPNVCVLDADGNEILIEKHLTETAVTITSLRGDYPGQIILT